MARTAQRRAKKRELRKQGEWLPGVPAFQDGGGVSIDDIMSQLTSIGRDPRQGAGNQQAALFQQGILRNQDRAQTLQEIQGLAQLLGIPVQQAANILSSPYSEDFIAQIMNRQETLFNRSLGGGGGGADPALLALRREEMGLQNQQFQADLSLRQAIADRENAIAQGNLALARQAEQRMAEAQRRQFMVDVARQNLSARGQQASTLGNLAASYGNLQEQRRQRLQELAATPRDFAQSQIALGNGTSFLQQLLSGRPVTGQGVGAVDRLPLLGQGYQDLVRQATATPENEYFGRALISATASTPQNELLNPQLMGAGFARGGEMMTDEPIVGMGMMSGMPRFTMGEPTPEFPMGKPEHMKITPIEHMQEGGDYTAGFGAGSSIGDVAQRVKAATPAPQQPIAFIPQPAQDALNTSVANFGQPGYSVGNIAQASRQATETGLNAGQVLQNLVRGFTPRSWMGLLPSQRELVGGIASFLGMPTEDFFTLVERQFPTGADPNRVSFGSFSKGGRISFIPSAA